MSRARHTAGALRARQHRVLWRRVRLHLQHDLPNLRRTTAAAAPEQRRPLRQLSAVLLPPVAHGGVPQRYPTIVLRLELERELDSLLREQVYERERATRFLLEQEDPDAAFETDSSDEEEKEKRGREEERPATVVRAWNA